MEGGKIGGDKDRRETGNIAVCMINQHLTQPLLCQLTILPLALGQLAESFLNFPQ